VYDEMPIRFKRGGISFTADTPEEAAQMLALLDQKDAEKHQARIKDMLNEGGTQELHRYLKEGPGNPWTPSLLWRFIDRLGKSQLDVLKLLVRFRHVTDEEFRACLKVAGNQALAGTLAGISKHAAALGIPARNVYSFENFRNAGKRRSTYTVADTFSRIATENNWPGPPEK
jgi:hypothetical protein